MASQELINAVERVLSLSPEEKIAEAKDLLRQAMLLVNEADDLLELLAMELPDTTAEKPEA